MKYSSKKIKDLTKEAALVEAWTYIAPGIRRTRKNLRAEYLKYVGTSTFDEQEIDNLCYDENGEADVEIYILDKEAYEKEFLANTSDKWPEELADNDKIALIIVNEE